MEINAVQIWIMTAFADVPAKVFIFRICSVVVKNMDPVLPREVVVGKEK